MSGRRTTVVLEVDPVYYRGEDAYFRIYHYVAGALTDATAVPTVTVTDHCGVKTVSAANSTKTTTGTYYYEYAIAAGATTGTYHIQVAATYDSITNMGATATFEVKREVG